MTEADLERYAEPRAFAREVNLPLLGEIEIAPFPAGAPLAELLRSPVPPPVAGVVDSLAQTRQSLTLRSLLLAGYAHDPELFALGLALAREWSRRGLRVAVVDLDAWSPSVVRPAGEPNEGLIDMLEFGCSFRRVAWEMVADRLWLVGPGSYLPEAERVVEHPDWDRVTRVLSNHVDVALYVAPHLERSGFLGRLSKRMDGVVVASATARVPRMRLRDSFLELWGSDAPMIGCLGILPAVASASPPPVASAFPAAAPAVPVPPAAAAGGKAAGANARFAPGGLGEGTAGPPRPAPGRSFGDRADDVTKLAAVLEHEAYSGEILAAAPRPRKRSGRWLTALAVLVVGGAAALVALRPWDGARVPAAFENVPPAGTEPVLPAQLGPAGDAGLPDVAPGGAPEETVAPPAGTPIAEPPADEAFSAPSPAPDASAAAYRVHVASFRSEDTVQRITGELRAKGLDARYEPAPDAPGWYRVFVGRFATHEEAAAEAARLLDRKLVDRAHAFPDPPR